MDKDQRAQLDAQLRTTALHQAANDYKGSTAAEEVVARAEAYYAFLRSALPSEG